MSGRFAQQRNRRKPHPGLATCRKRILLNDYGSPRTPRGPRIHHVLSPPRRTTGTAGAIPSHRDPKPGGQLPPEEPHPWSIVVVGGREQASTGVRGGAGSVQ